MGIEVKGRAVRDDSAQIIAISSVSYAQETQKCKSLWSVNFDGAVELCDSGPAGAPVTVSARVMARTVTAWPPVGRLT